MEDLQAWFKGKGSEENRLELTKFIKNLMPCLTACTHWHTDTCVVSQRPSGLPIIDYVDGRRIAAVVGGNGKGAKSADEWGRVAADLINGNG